MFGCGHYPNWHESEASGLGNQTTMSDYLDLSWTNKHPMVFSTREIGFALYRAIILSLWPLQYQTWKEREKLISSVYQLSMYHLSTSQERTVWHQHRRQCHKVHLSRWPPLSDRSLHLALPLPLSSEIWRALMRSMCCPSHKQYQDNWRRFEKWGLHLQNH